MIVSNSAGMATSTNVSLTVTTTTPATPVISGPVYSNGIFSLSVNGDAGHDYIIEASTNLTGLGARVTPINGDAALHLERI